MTKHRILFLAANPAGLAARRLDAAAREIEEELRRSAARDQFELVPRLAAQPLDLLRALREVKPSIVHCIGHGGADGIYLIDQAGRPMPVTREALRATFGAAGASVQIVVLDGCAAPRLAEVLCELVAVCVGTSAAVGDHAARAFGVGFYGALASSASAASACAQGRAAMLLEAASDHEPLLRHRRDVDPATLVLAGSSGAPSRSREVVDVVERYRARKRGSFARWDLRIAGSARATSHRPGELTLDQMYVPLRFAEELAIDEPYLGWPIHPRQLIEPRKPQVVIGAAGSGKTTWMRWTFRRLIEDPRAVPFFLELRAIAAAWQPRDAARSLEHYLAGELRACGASDPDPMVPVLLAEADPHPVILIDGWDELGDLGERLRERLVEFCRAYPHVTVVVSSRPYGETRPAGAEEFETVHIQPLNDAEISALAYEFHLGVHAGDKAAAGLATEEFRAALAAAPGARSLAGTPLLLTMMMLLGREGPLPDRRHQLYTACVRALLLHRVAQREREGVAADLEQWRPDDGEERLRAVAELAYRMQADGGYFTWGRGPIVRTWREAVDLLGDRWARDRRERFLRWLVASAGILVDRTDSSIQFVHLSFQEYLAAHHLRLTTGGEALVAELRSHAGHRGWWETLRLWAALIGDESPDVLGPALDALRVDADAYWLAGQMLTDGTGRGADFDAWVAELPTHLQDPFAWWEDCASAWAACKQEARRRVMAAVLMSAREGLHWLAGCWHASWCKTARLDVEPAPALVAIAGPIESAGAVARSRALFCLAPGWPDAGVLAMLRLWPSPRLAIGARLQTAISLGVPISDVAAMLPPLLDRAVRPWSDEERDLAECLAAGIARDLLTDVGPELVMHLARDLGRGCMRDLGRDFGLSFLGKLSWYASKHDGRRLLRNFGSLFAHELWLLRNYFEPDYVRLYIDRLSAAFSRYFARTPDLGLSWYLGLRDQPTPPWLPALVSLEVGSVVGRASPRFALAHGQVPARVPLLALFRAACLASLEPADAGLRVAVAVACEAYRGDALWPALARHVARISTAEDRALLEELACQPEQRAPPLAWGLQHYVRGDIVLDNGSVVMLDELCARAGLAPMPLLEDMPDELRAEIVTTKSTTISRHPQDTTPP